MSALAVSTTVLGSGSWKATTIRPATGSLAGWARYTRSTSTAVSVIQNDARPALKSTAVTGVVRPASAQKPGVPRGGDRSSILRAESWKSCRAPSRS